MNGKETGPEARGEKLQQWGEEIDELKAALKKLGLSDKVDLSL